MGGILAGLIAGYNEYRNESASTPRTPPVTAEEVMKSGHPSANDLQGDFCRIVIEEGGDVASRPEYRYARESDVVARLIEDTVKSTRDKYNIVSDREAAILVTAAMEQDPQLAGASGLGELTNYCEAIARAD